MVTNSYETLVVSKIVPKVAPNGKLIGLIKLEGSEEGILVDNFLEIRDCRINTGSKLLIKGSDDTLESRLNPITSVNNDNSTTLILPSECPSCRHELVRVYNDKKLLDHIVCNNVLCYANSRSHLYILIKKAWASNERGSISDTAIKLFLDFYPTSSSSDANIQNASDFIHIALTSTYDKVNTETRFNNWLNVYKRRSEFKVQKKIKNENLLHKIELSVYKYLSSKNLDICDFWKVTNFKLSNIDSKEKNILIHEVNPHKLLKGDTSVFKMVPKEVHDIFMTNYDFVILVLELFNKLGNKEWI